MLTVCAPADVVSESATAADAPSVEIFISVIRQVCRGEL
jgi:hypothetical protein